MTVRSFLIGTLLALVASWGMWLLIIFWLDPAEAGWIGFALFFLTLFLAVAATSALGGYALRRVVAPQQLAAYRVRSALRQGVWLGLLIDMLLFLQLQRLLRWWITLILIGFFLFIEFFFVSYDRSARHNPADSAES